MKILLTADTVGGVWTYAMELARALTPHGIRVALATMGDPMNSGQHAEAEAIPGLQVYESHYKLEWMEDPWEEVERAGDWLLGIERDFGPDIIHLNGYVHGVLPWRAPALVVGHSCVLSWWQAVKGEAAPPAWDRYRSEVTKGVQVARRVVAPTAWMIAQMEHYYGPLPHSVVIPNGRDPYLFQPAQKEPFILTAGRLWDEAKNIRALDDAAGNLPWPVYAAGEAVHPAGGSARQENIRPLGMLAGEDLVRRLGRAAIYALPARYEPFGLSILEAALSGCALVLGDIPSLREVWGDAALFVPPDDHQALSAALRSLIENPAELARLAAAAQDRAALYTPERMAANYLHLYRSLHEEASCAL